MFEFLFVQGKLHMLKHEITQKHAFFMESKEFKEKTLQHWMDEFERAYQPVETLFRQLLPDANEQMNKAIQCAKQLQDQALKKWASPEGLPLEMVINTVFPSEMIRRIRMHFFQHRDMTEKTMIRMGEAFVQEYPEWRFITEDLSRTPRSIALKKYPTTSCICLDSFKLFVQKLHDLIQNSPHSVLVYACDMDPKLPLSHKDQPRACGVIFELGAMKAIRRKCSGPGCSKTETSLCSRCSVAAYCGPECQKADWKLKHKLECKAGFKAVNDVLWEMAVHRLPPIFLRFSQQGVSVTAAVSSEPLQRLVTKCPKWQSKLEQVQAEMMTARDVLQEAHEKHEGSKKDKQEKKDESQKQKCCDRSHSSHVKRISDETHAQLSEMLDVCYMKDLAGKRYLPCSADPSEAIPYHQIQWPEPGSPEDEKNYQDWMSGRY